MKIKCMAIDDEPAALEKLQNYINRIPFLQLIAACDGPVEAMAVMEREEIDAVFIDINMPDINGMEFIASMPSPPLTVFITAYSEFAVDSYKVGAIDYLLKPYSFADLQRAAERIRCQHELQKQAAMQQQDCIFIRTDSKWVKTNVSDILYIQGYGDYLKIHLNNAKPLTTLSTFAKIKSSLPQHFIQVHRSYIVNLHHIKETDRARIVIGKDTVIPIGDTYKEAFKNCLEK